MEIYSCTITKGTLVGWDFGRSAVLRDEGRNFFIGAEDEASAQMILQQHVGPITQYPGAEERKPTGWDISIARHVGDRANIDRLVKITQANLGSIEIVAALIEMRDDHHASSIRVTAREGEKVRVLVQEFGRNDHEGFLGSIEDGVADKITSKF